MATTTNNYNNMVPRPFFGNRVQERRGFYVHKKIYLVKTPLSNHEHGKKGRGDMLLLLVVVIVTSLQTPAGPKPT